MLSRPDHRLERWWARRVVAALGIDLVVEGAEHVAPGGPYVVVALHESVVDPVALLHLGLDLRFVIRDEILDWRYFGDYLATKGHIEIRPEDGRAAYRRMLQGAEDVIAQGESLAVFPQGTLLGIETAFQPGAFHLAARLGVPVLPVVITGGHRVWERPFSTTVRTGERMGMRVLPSVPATTVVADGPEAVRLRLEQEMKRHALDETMPPPRRFDPDRDGCWPGYRYDIDGAFPEVRDRLEEILAQGRPGQTRSEGTSPKIARSPWPAA